MKKLTLLTVLTVVLDAIGCSPEEMPVGTTLHVSVALSLTDNAGNDLLNPNNSNSSFNDVNQIKTFQILDGEVVEVYEPHLDAPRHFRIYEHENEYRIGINLNHSKKEELPVTLIQWNETDVDTIRAKFDHGDNHTLPELIWLNDELIWDKGEGYSKTYFEITK